jgi:dihydroorotate dehydrogenase
MPFYSLLRPLIFALDAERAHSLTLATLKLLPPIPQSRSDARLKVRLAGLDFPNPVGLAAGFDKNAEVYRQMLRLGFGFVEVGTLTPLEQAGNPRPRLFRLEEDKAIINRMGFNNDGLGTAKRRLSNRNRNQGIVGINIGANKDSVDRIRDYKVGVYVMAQFADYLTINISSPNTPGLRALQGKGALEELLQAVVEARGTEGPPLFLKIAPDLEQAGIDDIASAAIRHSFDALIISNTTVSRPGLKSRHRAESGGLSGAPLKPLALQRLRDFRSATGGKIALVAAGGIENGVDAYDRIKAGASLVQLYSALVYQGPGLVRRINRELCELIERDGFSSISEAVGIEAR